MKHSFGRVYRSKTWGKKRMGVRVTSNKNPRIISFIEKGEVIKAILTQFHESQKSVLTFGSQYKRD
ncbi:MAG: hypothetical protein AUK00_01260 [Dehalococcoidia bacterium CG2_30_46_9]|nr:MAG: hypothetical protein AUK00_01260 [Dehalococcoidia bacterium CG2_30_46_9]